MNTKALKTSLELASVSNPRKGWVWRITKEGWPKVQHTMYPLFTFIFFGKKCFIIRISQCILLGVSWDMIEEWLRADWEAWRCLWVACPSWKVLIILHSCKVIDLMPPQNLFLILPKVMHVHFSTATNPISWKLQGVLKVMGWGGEGWRSLGQRWATWTGGVAASSQRRLQL